MDPGDIYRKPRLPRQKSPLRIDVPNESTPTLGDPIKLSSSSPTSPNINFDTITQLPTPIINNGSFAADCVTLDIPKRMSPRKSDHRTVSDYKPTPVLKNAVLDTFKNNDSKRIVSNPAAPSTIPSPPTYLSLDPSNYKDGVYFAPHLNKSYRSVEEVGSGNFSTVVAAVNTTNSTEKIAIKIISIPVDGSADLDDFKSFIRRELNVLHQLNHPCLILLLDYSTTLNIASDEITDPMAFSTDDCAITESEKKNLTINNNQLFFLNYCAGGNLFRFSYVYAKANSSSLGYWLIIERVVCELIMALVYLHSNGIIHRDIKLENILLNHPFAQLQGIVSENHNYGTAINEPIVCLTDFGLSKKLSHPDELLTTRCGSEDYIAPELLMGLKYNGFLTDAWSVGVVIYALLEDRLPFDAPPLDLLANSGVSPSVIRRRRAKNNPAHRIAMLDWDWFNLNENDLSSSSGDHTSIHSYSPDIQAILKRLKSVVNVLLVRKDKRMTLAELVNSSNFAWIKANVPEHFNPL